jgi:ADP-ribose pyrophosphatase YjhB (NUDIX family)
LPEKLFNKIYSLVPRLALDIIIKNKDGIVLAKRDIPKCKGMWHIPGGTLMLGESIDKNVKRIAKYETGLNVEIFRLIGVKEYTKKSSFFKTISIVYLTNPISGNLKGNNDGKNVKFFKKIPKNFIKEQKDIFLNVLK